MSENKVPITQEEFRVHVVEELATLKIVQKSVLDQVTEMNGTQAELLDRMTNVETDQEVFQATHPLTCPIGERVGKIEITLTKESVARETDKKWLVRFKPYILLAVGAMSAVLLSHIDLWIKKL